MIFMLTSAFSVSRLQRQKKIKNDTKSAKLFELKAIINQSLKESFPLALFCSLVLIYVGYNSEHVEVDEGKQKVYLLYRKMRGHNARKRQQASRRKPHSGISRIKQSRNSRILKENSAQDKV